MAERIFRLGSLFLLGLGLAMGVGIFEHHPERIAKASANPQLEIEAAQEIQRINRGEYDLFQHPGHLTQQQSLSHTKPMAASNY